MMNIRCWIVAGMSVLAVGMWACQEQGAAPSAEQVPAAIVAGEVEGTPRIEWADTLHHMGDVPEGAVAYYAFKFRNVGDAPLVIGSVSTSCGCTVSDYPRRPIPPGEEGEIEVKFDSRGRKGRFVKTVTVITNAEPSRHVLKITGNVVQL